MTASDESGRPWLVVTTIQPPNAVLRALAEGAAAAGWTFAVVGDAKGPAAFELAGARFVSLEAQRALPGRFPSLCPVNHYARKNVGYLLAARAGASCVVETDDDNAPLPAFFAPRTLRTDARLLGHDGWVNVYGLFSDAPVWPRGLPLDRIRSSPPVPDETTRSILAPIQQGLANESPDTDAIYRLVYDAPVTFRDEPPVALEPGAWCPFNSQNTTWLPEALPLAYLPATCSFRMTDIWRSLVAQRIAWANGWRIVFHGPTVRQDRNPHDLLQDFAAEVPGYLGNREIADALASLELEPGADRLGANLVRCYRVLADQGRVEAGELDLLQAWLDDLGEARGQRAVS